MRDTLTLDKKELTEGGTPRLDARFRCDHGECGAQAYVETVMNNGLPLYWCAHHYDKLEMALIPQVQSVYHERVRLIENRKQGSEN